MKQFIILSALALSSTAFSNCLNSLAVGAEYLGYSNSSFGLGELNYEKGFNAIEDLDIENGCLYLGEANNAFNKSIEEAYLSAAEFANGEVSCERAKQIEAQTSRHQANERMALATYFKALTEQEIEYSCR